MTNRKKSISRNPRPRKWEREHPARAVRFASKEELSALQQDLSAANLSLREALLDWQQRWEAEQERAQANIEVEALQQAIKEGEQRLAEVQAALKAVETRHREVTVRFKRAHDSVRTIKARAVKEGLAEGRRQALEEARRLEQEVKQRAQVSELLAEMQKTQLANQESALASQRENLERAATVLTLLFLCPETEEIAREWWRQGIASGVDSRKWGTYRAITSIAQKLRQRHRDDPEMPLLDFWGGE